MTCLKQAVSQSRTSPRDEDKGNDKCYFFPYFNSQKEHTGLDNDEHAYK